MVLNSDDSKFQIMNRVILKPFLGDGLVRARGAVWELHRKLLSIIYSIVLPSFSVLLVKSDQT